MEVTESAVEVPTLQTPVKKETRTQQTSLHSPSVSRFTRSQVAPDWTVQEMLVLVNEFVAVNKDCLRKLPSYQKWKMISENMAALHVNRSSNQCQRKWESLLSDYKKIKDWESQSGTGSFWYLESERRKEFGLPALFDRELFSLMDAILVVQRSRLMSEIDSDSERLSMVKVKSLTVTGPPGFGKEARSETWTGNASKELDMAKKLQESTQLIHAILGRKQADSMGSGCSPDSKNPIDLNTGFASQQADELIKVFESLVGTLNQFTELVKGSG